MPQSVEAAARSLSEAPWTPGTWPAALSAMAEASGFRSGHLIGADAALVQTFSIGGGLQDEVVEAWLKMGGQRAISNPRAAALFGVPFFKVIEEVDFISDRDRVRHPMYESIYNPFDVGSSCMVKVPTWDGGTAFLTIMRSSASGRTTKSERRAFSSLIARFAEAVRLQTLLEGQIAQLTACTFEALNIPVIFCDRTGKVTAVSASAEAILSESLLLTVRNGRLAGTVPREDSLLRAVLDELFQRKTLDISNDRVLFLTGPTGLSPTRVDVSRLPAGAFGRAVVAIIVRKLISEDSVDNLLRLGLTPAEAAVAAAISSGISPPLVAVARKVSVGTVRAQIKSIYAKIGVNNQIQMLNKLRSIG